MGITKIDWNFLCSKNFILKAMLSIGFLFLLFVGYSLFFPSPSPRDLVDRQFKVIDSLVTIYKSDTELTAERKEEIREQTNRIFQNYAQEDMVYVSNDSVEKLVPIFEERLTLLEEYEQLFPEYYQEYLPDKKYVEQEFMVVQFLVKRHQDYTIYKLYGPFFEKLLIFLGYGGSLLIFTLLTGSYFQRKYAHYTLLEILPVTRKREVLIELPYTIVLFYLFPTSLIFLYAGLYSIFIAKTNLFTYPVYQMRTEGQVLLSMAELSITYLLFPFLSCLLIYILQDYLIGWMKDSTVTTILIYAISLLSIWNKHFWSPLFHMFPLPILQSDTNMWLSLVILLITTLVLLIGREYLSVRSFLFPN